MKSRKQRKTENKALQRGSQQSQWLIITIPHMTEAQLTMCSRKASVSGPDAARSRSENLKWDLLPWERTRKRPTQCQEIKRAIEKQDGKDFMLLQQREKKKVRDRLLQTY